jgi:hypothetical protein
MANLAARALDACEADHMRVKILARVRPDGRMIVGRFDALLVLPTMLCKKLGAPRPSLRRACRVGRSRQASCVAEPPQDTIARVYPGAEPERSYGSQPIGAGVAEWQTRQTKNLISISKYIDFTNPPKINVRPLPPKHDDPENDKSSLRRPNPPRP